MGHMELSVDTAGAYTEHIWNVNGTSMGLREHGQSINGNTQTLIEQQNMVGVS